MALYSPEDRNLVLSLRPGITGPASVEFKDESEILGQALDPEAAYRTDILPRKLAYYRAYVRERSFGGDLAIICADLEGVCLPRRLLVRAVSRNLPSVVCTDQMH